MSRKKLTGSGTPSLSLDAPTIAWKDLTLGPLIGNGSYGDVYQGQWRGKAVAIKLLQLKTLPEALAKEFAQETSIMWKCDSPHSVRLYGVCTEAGHYAMVMEYLPHGTLRHRLQSQANALSWPQRVMLAIDISQGLSYLHGQGILHRDLKSFNILLDLNDRAKIADFGLARVKLEVSSTTTKSSKAAGTVRWRAPELFKRNTPPTQASDVYSLGMILWEIISLKLPYADGDEQTVISWIKDGEQETIPENCPKAYAEVIRACWEKDPNKRPTAEAVLTQLKQIHAEHSHETKATPEKVWHFDATTKPAANEIKEYALIEASAKDKQKVATFYQQGPANGYDIKSVKVIYSPALNRSFALAMQLLKERDNNPAFAPKWQTENDSAWRSKIHAFCETLSKPYQDDEFPGVKLLPLWHGTRPEILPSIFKAGFANLATLDAGYFGKGLYSAYEADYAYKIYSKGALLVNWVAYFSAYPVIDGDMGKLTGKANYQNYDAHFVPVVPQFPDADNESFIPCKPNQVPQCTEVVVFERAQCLPRYLVELQPSLPKAPSPNTPVMNFFAHAQAKKEEKPKAASSPPTAKTFGS